MANGVMRPAAAPVNPNLGPLALRASTSPGFLSTMSSAFSAASRAFSNLFIRPTFRFFSALGDAVRSCCDCCCKRPLPVVYRNGQQPPQVLFVPQQQPVFMAPQGAPPGAIQAGFGARGGGFVVAGPGPNIAPGPLPFVAGPNIGGPHIVGPGPGGQAGFGARNDHGPVVVGHGPGPMIGPGPGHHPGAHVNAGFGARRP